jgi:protein-S-isoprenylcysteine O-methyltransferase Ste14
MSLLSLLFIVWPISEIVLSVVKRANRRTAEVRDRGSMTLLWIVIALSVTAGMFLQFQDIGRIAVAPGHLRLVALLLLVMGLAIRWTAILTLGRLFNTNVAVQKGHTIVRRGLYSRVRHPSYSGLMLAFVALGIAFGNWLSLIAVVVPIGAALGYRISVEERALVETFGQEYEDYMSGTRRLIPWLY